MSTTYQGTASNVTSPLSATITGVVWNGSTLVVTTSAAHNFQTGDQIIISGVAWGGGITPVNNARSNPWTVTVLSATTFGLNSSTNPGSTYVSGGTATDLSLTPATTLPSDGDARSAASVNVALETALDRTQYIQSARGRYRFVDQYVYRAIDDAFASYASMTPSASPGTATVTGATNASPIVITTSAAHGFTTGDTIQILNVLGNTAANGTWIITVQSSTTFALTGPNGSTGNGAYVSGGNVFKNWVTMSGMTAMLPFDGVAKPSPQCNENDVIEVKFFTTAGWGANAQGICLGLSLAGGSYQPISGSGFLGTVSAKVPLALRGLVVVGDAAQPLNSGTNNQLFNFAVMLVTNAGSPQSVNLYGSRELVVNHYRQVA